MLLQHTCVVETASDASRPSDNVRHAMERALPCCQSGSRVSVHVIVLL